MTRRMQIVTGMTLLLASSGLALGTGKDPGLAGPFGVALVRLEQNVTDGDSEVVFEVKAGKEGLAKLTVVAPDGRTVVDFTAPDASTLGIRQFRFETPEPRDFKTLKSAYPEGVYTFAGVTATGGKLRGQATLQHALPAATSFVSPRAGARGVVIKNLRIAWNPVKNPAAYIVKIEGRKPEANLTVQVPGTVSTFVVPDGFLVPGAEYGVAIGTVSEKRNISFVETTFTTGGESKATNDRGVDPALAALVR